jgi:hypothetical protein
MSYIKPTNKINKEQKAREFLDKVMNLGVRFDSSTETYKEALKELLLLMGVVK